MNIREQIERAERGSLSPLAMLAENTAGRRYPIEECPMRTAFQRDRDRILHCKAFRRLKHKTQVFLSPAGDHYRTRLTHTLEVSQLARTVSRALRLNEDLTEAIALGHDLGHTPFGHAGEAALNEICPHGFVHARQSVRVVEKLENGGEGLNLTREVVDGIVCHSGGPDAQTLEGRVVRYADKIAYMNHDIEDAIRGGVLSEEDIPWEIKYHVGRNKSERITTFLVSLVENSSDDIRMSPQIQSCFESLRAFMFAEVYTNPDAKGEEGKAQDLIRYLYTYYMKKPDALPEEYQAISREEDVHRAVCDYISGMSDRYAINLYESLFVPKSWGL
jgi:dGTPase